MKFFLYNEVKVTRETTNIRLPMWKSGKRLMKKRRTGRLYSLWHQNLSNRYECSPAEFLPTVFSWVKVDQPSTREDAWRRKRFDYDSLVSPFSVGAHLVTAFPQGRMNTGFTAFRGNSAVAPNFWDMSTPLLFQTEEQYH